jgi:hypothetical protein
LQTAPYDFLRMSKLKAFEPSEGLCTAVQPDGRHQRCIRFEQHEGPHQTFVAEWAEGELASHRRQLRQPRIVNPAATRQPHPSSRGMNPAHSARLHHGHAGNR